MPGTKEIRSKIASIKNTQKITKAMQMVAASKIRKAQERMQAARPYAEKLRSSIGHLRFANPDYKHPFLKERPVKGVGIIIISADRGLAGGLNINLFKLGLKQIQEAQARGEQVHLCLIGLKATVFFRRLGVPVDASITHLGDRPTIAQLIGAVKVMLDLYRTNGIDELKLLNNVFVNTMTQKPTVRKLLPVQPTDADKLQTHWDYIYEPSAAELLDGLLMRYVESQVYQGAVENAACEQAARMVAMKAATDNAGNLISELQLIYNKARQAAITTELSEIVGGAAAV